MHGPLGLGGGLLNEVHGGRGVVLFRCVTARDCVTVCRSPGASIGCVVIGHYPLNHHPARRSWEVQPKSSVNQLLSSPLAEPVLWLLVD